MAKDRQKPPEETPYRIEPCLLDVYPARLADVISEVVSASAKLGHRGS